MANQTHILDLPNEILRNHILLRLNKDDLFWKVGLVCQRLMYLTVDIYNVIHICFEYLSCYKKEHEKHNFLGFNDSTYGYAMKRNDTLKMMLNGALMNKEIAHHVKYFKFNATEWNINAQNRIIVDFCANSVLNDHSKETETEILNLVSRSCPNLEEIYIDTFALDKLQIMAKNCVNLKTVAFARIGHYGIVKSLIEAIENDQSNYDLEIMRNYCFENEFTNREWISYKFVQIVQITVTNSRHLKRLSMTGPSAFNRLLDYIMRNYQKFSRPSVPLCQVVSLPKIKNTYVE